MAAFRLCLEVEWPHFRRVSRRRFRLIGPSADWRDFRTYSSVARVGFAPRLANTGLVTFTGDIWIRILHVAFYPPADSFGEPTEIGFPPVLRQGIRAPQHLPPCSRRRSRDGATDLAAGPDVGRLSRHGGPHPAPRQVGEIRPPNRGGVRTTPGGEGSSLLPCLAAHARALARVRGLSRSRGLLGH